MSKSRQEVVLNLPVEFSGVAIGEGVARIGFRVRRENLNILAADESLCGRRLTGRAIVTPGSDAANQTYIEGTAAADGKHEIEGTFDVKRFSVSTKFISAGLTFNLEEIDIKQLGHFSKRSGFLVVNDVGEIPAKAKKPKAVKVRVSGNGKPKGEKVAVSARGGAKRRGGTRLMTKPK